LAKIDMARAGFVCSLNGLVALDSPASKVGGDEEESVVEAEEEAA